MKGWIYLIDTPNLQHLIHILSKFGNKYIDQNNQLKRQDLLTDVNNYNKALIQTLISDPETSHAYFVHLNGVYVFKIDKFTQAVRDADYYKKSHTDYENHVGLAIDRHYLNDSSNVVLDFPHKDCVLQGGMTTEDTKHNVNELFYNDVISATQIDNMFAPKILCNVKKYDQNHLDGKPITNFDPDKDNLMIKANNLIALHSLAQSYTNKIKMIYIDPPYNTGNDSFKYNDRFNESTWLVFMKNRLDVAKRLLKLDGSIFISCDDNEQSYLKVLCDEIFGKENFITLITDVNNRKGNQDQFGFAKTHDYVLVYVKDINTAINEGIFNNLPLSKSELRDWSKDSRGLYKKGANLKSSGVNAPRSKRPNLFYPIYISKDNDIHLNRENSDDIKVLPRSNGEDMSWRWDKSHLASHLFDVIVTKSSNGYSLYKKQRNPSKKPKTLFDKPQYSSGTGTNELKHLFHKKVFSFPKPEELIADLIRIGTNPKDIVLDFFAGSATTQAVAMKLHRHFIGIEQMNYIDTVSVPRLQKVINGDQGGISTDPDVNWQGGGSFIFATFLNKNQKFIQLVQNAKDSDQLDHIYHQMKASADIRLDVDLKKYESKADNLPREKKRRCLIDMLDKNQLYYNYADIDDSNIRSMISDTDYQFNRSFYDGGNNK